MDKYEEALEKARAEYEKAREQGYTWLMGLLEGMFPELKDSEDERVRKALIDGVRQIRCKNGITQEQMLAYLEKLKDLDKMIVVSPEVWDNAIADAYENGKKDNEKQKEQKPAGWSEKDERIRKAILRFLNPDKGGTKYSSNAELVEWSDWLKSLRPPQYCENCKLKRSVENWKPSEEQMGMLLAVINDPNNAGAESCHLMLQSLYADLQKLL